MKINPEHTIIGIDGGGTHTRGILYREGKIAATAKAGTTRIGAVGVGESCERTLNVIRELCKEGGISSEELDAVVVGLAGVWLEEEKQRSTGLLRTLAKSYNYSFNDLVITSDAELALEGAFGGKEGIIVIVGTGSIALGNPAKSPLVRCGGWGIELDDEGSGAWIGREGLTAVVKHLDGRGSHTDLTEIVGQLSPSIKIEEPRTIVKAYAEGSFQYSMISPMVMKCATEGDEICRGIIERAAVHLLELPVTLAGNFSAKQVPVALMGGVVESDTLLAKLLKDLIKKQKNLKLTEPAGNALEGALIIGERLINEDME